MYHQGVTAQELKVPRYVPDSEHRRSLSRSDFELFSTGTKQVQESAGRLISGLHTGLRQDHVGSEFLSNVILHDLESPLGLGAVKSQPELVQPVSGQIEVLE